MNDLDSNILHNLLRIGTVSSVDTSKCRARVYFPDKNYVSGWLSVIQTSKTEWVPKVNEEVVCLYLPVFNGDGFVLGGIV